MSEFYAVCFDICDARRLRRVADQLENFGVRVQKSLFECYLDMAGLAELKRRLLAEIDEEEDHVRFYPLCPKDIPEIVIDGKGRKTVDMDYFML